MVAQPGGLSATPPSFVSPTDLLRVHSFNQLMKMLNDIGPSTDPWGTLLVIGLQMDFVLLIRTF